MARYDAYVNATFNVYVRKAGAWTQIGQVTGVFYGSKTNNAASAAYGKTSFSNIQLGTGIEAFGITLASVDGGTVSSYRLDSVSWTASGAPSGVRSALPNGARTTVTVRPK
jgi:hypothetical protein